MRDWIQGRRLPLILLALLLLPCAAAADDLKADIRTGIKLLNEGDKLADKGNTTDAVLKYKNAFEQLLPGMRKIPFKHEVKRDVTAREKLREVLVKEIDSEMTPGEFRANELGMKAIGFLPKDINLKEIMVKVYAEEIAAFYDTKTKTMHLIKEPEEKNKKPPTLLQRLMGKTNEFDKDENKTVIAHELTHALADQNYNLDAMQQAVKHDDDRDLALSALIEGEATLAMFGANIEDWNGTEIIKVPASRLEFLFSLMKPFIPMTSGAGLREAPVILSETMIFPYFNGMVFCARLTNDGGWKAIDDAYRQPPLSTEQILHPEKYRARPDRPMAIDLGTLEPGGEWKALGRNVVGEMQLGVLVRKHGGKAAAAGWDGDRYAVFEAPKDRLGLVWFSTWDTVDDAREFATAYARFQTTKLGEGTDQLDDVPDRLLRPLDGTIFAIERRGQDIVVVEGFNKETTEKMLAAAFKAKKTEITNSLPPLPKPN